MSCFAVLHEKEFFNVGGHAGVDSDVGAGRDADGACTG